MVQNYNSKQKTHLKTLWPPQCLSLPAGDTLWQICIVSRWLTQNSLKLFGVEGISYAKLMQGRTLTGADGTTFSVRVHWLIPVWCQFGKSLSITFSSPYGPSHCKPWWKLTKPTRVSFQNFTLLVFFASIWEEHSREFSSNSPIFQNVQWICLQYPAVYKSANGPFT